MVSALEIHGVPIECINHAAITYNVPAALIISVLAVESGEVGMASPNKNGTYDYGPMQINTIWLERIRPYGYTREKIQFDPCANVMVGTWILSMNIADASDLWRGVGGYHSYTPHLNHAYGYKVSGFYKKLADYLSNSQTTNSPTTAHILTSNNPPEVR